MANIDMNTPEIIRHAFHAVKQLGVPTGATVKVDGLTLLVKHHDDSIESFRFQWTSGGEEMRYVHRTDNRDPLGMDSATETVKMLNTDSAIRDQVRAVLAWVLA
jgi:hypothetical protein